MKTNKLIVILIILINSYCFAGNTKWTKIFVADSSLFMGIDNADTNYCMAVGSFGPYKSIYKTTDAGSTWNRIYKDTFIVEKWDFMKEPYDISYPTRDFCIIGCDSSTFFKTTDGGITWNEYKIDIPYTWYGFYDVDMFDENNGVMASQRYLAVSHDGFNSWDTIPSPSGDYIFAVEMATPNSICVLCRDYKVSDSNYVRFYRSDNGGKIWDEYPITDYCNPQALQFIDSLNGFEVGYLSTGHGQQQQELVYKTTDGGRSWDKSLDTIIYLSFGLQKLDFYDKDNGIVVGQFGAIFWTHDGGKSWFFDSSGVVYDKIPATMNVCYIRKDRAIIVDFLDRIFISEIVDDVEDEIPSDDDFVLYPNPAKDKIKIKLKYEFINSTQIQIFNSYGQEIINKSPSDLRLTSNDFRLVELDVTSLPSGVYFIVISGSGKVRTISFVVMR